jgi:hypothetical protein
LFPGHVFLFVEAIRSDSEIIGADERFAQPSGGHFAEVLPRSTNESDVPRAAKNALVAS